eukprot:CAMPEP_0174257258 /NCGR_PEP_ID=MMETSP0439-20130205/6424_1 /TAXON_ID=0 /ORGANISM="Stereomyxa ramosa, Strain Chinc5" /LENGTH=180 /DNA_ID=CAMNT_0015340267 /DNA_START=320 /DNA_END=862 /DNA_ORIENTATION=-
MNPTLTWKFLIHARDQEGNTSLLKLVSLNGSDDTILKLICSGADVNAQNYRGLSALMIACGLGLKNKVEYLLENGANVNLKSVEGATALHYAAAAGEVEIMDDLVSFGAFVNVSDEVGDSPLHWAVREAHKDAVDLLLVNGADPSLENEDGENVFMLANCLGHMEMGLPSQVRSVKNLSY